MNPDTNGLLTSNLVGRRWASALMRRFPGPFRAKAIAKTIGCDVRTAESWLAGQAPYLHVAISAAITLRDPLLLFEIADLPVPEEADLAKRIDALRGDFDALGARIAAMKRRTP